MKSITQLTYLITSIMIAMTLTFLSCSDPDPCADIACVNGSCETDGCNCDPGFYGPDCSVVKLDGFYFITAVSMESCPDYLKEYNLTAPVSARRVCGPNHNDIELCFSNGITIREDGTMNWIRSITLDKGDGTVETNFLEFKKGTYIASGDVMTITLENGDIRNMFIDEQGRLTWVFTAEEGGAMCMRQEQYTINL